MVIVHSHHNTVAVGEDTLAKKKSLTHQLPFRSQCARA